MIKLEKYIKDNYGSVYRAAKVTGRTESQLRRWIAADAQITDEVDAFTSKGRIVKGEVFFSKGFL